MTDPSLVREIAPPISGTEVIKAEDIRRSLLAMDTGSIAIGIGVADTTTRDMQIDQFGIAYVDMNKSGRLNLGPGEHGIIATSSLAGCTGVAGFAKRKGGGSMQFVSHYDAISQTAHFTRQSSPINAQLYGFRHEAGKDDELDGPLQFLVAYPDEARRNPYYGKRHGSFQDWTYLDQIEMTASQLGPEAQVLFLPYNNGEGNNLSAGSTDTAEGIFWNGLEVNFSEMLATS